MMNHSLPVSRQIALFAVLATVALFPPSSSAGSLNPSGPPGPTMKDLDWVEGRIPVETLPGTSNALYLISQPGSYYLTGNIVGVSGKGGILIDSNDVTLDLNGFALEGASGGSGVFMTSYWSMVTVKNGTLSGWGESGVALNDCTNCRALDLLIENTGGDGTYASLLMGPRSQVRHCMSRGNNNGIGIQVLEGSLVEDCFSGQNSIGYQLSGGFTMILRSQAVNNWDRGIYMQEAGIVSECVVQGGGASGIIVSQDALVSRNTTWISGTGVFAEWSRNLIEDNFVHSSDVAGIGVAANAHSSVIRRNQCSLGGNWGIQTIDADTNLVISNSVHDCPMPYTGPGVYGIIFDFTGGITITSARPWANIIH